MHAHLEVDYKETTLLASLTVGRIAAKMGWSLQDALAQVDSTYHEGTAREYWRIAKKLGKTGELHSVCKATELDRELDSIGGDTTTEDGPGQSCGIDDELIAQPTNYFPAPVIGFGHFDIPYA